jgi:hypothetical protein
MAALPRRATTQPEIALHTLQPMLRCARTPVSMTAPTRFEDLFEAFQFVSAAAPLEHEAYLCVESGAIYYHSEYSDLDEQLPDDIDDAQKYIPVPHKNDLDLGRPLALEFVGEVLPEALTAVEGIFRHKGAYARFKDLLERRGFLEQWYAYEDERQKRALRQWCEDTGLEVSG